MNNIGTGMLLKNYDFNDYHYNESNGNVPFYLNWFTTEGQELKRGGTAPTIQNKREHIRKKPFKNDSDKFDMLKFAPLQELNASEKQPFGAFKGTGNPQTVLGQKKSNAKLQPYMKNDIQKISKIYNNNFARPEKNLRKIKPESTEGHTLVSKPSKNLLQGPVKNSSDGFTKGRIRISKRKSQQGSLADDENAKRPTSEGMELGANLKSGLEKKEELSAFERKIMTSEGKKSSKVAEEYLKKDRSGKIEANELKSEEPRVLNAIIKDNVIKFGPQKFHAGNKLDLEGPEEPKKNETSFRTKQKKTDLAEECPDEKDNKIKEKFISEKKAFPGTQPITQNLLDFELAEQMQQDENGEQAKMVTTTQITEIEESEVLNQLMVDSRVANQNRPKTSEGGRRKRGLQMKNNNISTQALNAGEFKFNDSGIGKFEGFNERRTFEPESEFFFNDNSEKIITVPPEVEANLPASDNINFELIQKLQNQRPPCRKKGQAFNLEDSAPLYKPFQFTSPVKVSHNMDVRPPSRHKTPPKALGLEIPDSHNNIFPVKNMYLKGFDNELSPGSKERGPNTKKKSEELSIDLQESFNEFEKFNMANQVNLSGFDEDGLFFSKDAQANQKEENNGIEILNKPDNYMSSDIDDAELKEISKKLQRKGSDKKPLEAAVFKEDLLVGKPSITQDKKTKPRKIITHPFSAKNSTMTGQLARNFKNSDKETMKDNFLDGHHSHKNLSCQKLNGSNIVIKHNKSSNMRRNNNNNVTLPFESSLGQDFLNLFANSTKLN